MILSHNEYINELIKIIGNYVDVGSSILDLGCGGADILVKLPSSRAYGVDTSISRLEEAKQRRGISRLCCSFAEALPFPPSVFDFVFTHHVIEHLQDDVQAVAEIRRITRLGGLVMVIGSVTRVFPLKIYQAFGLMKDPDHINIKPSNYWIELFSNFGMQYLRNFQDLVKRDYPNHRGRMLLRFGPVGHQLCELISNTVRGSYLFEVVG